VKRLLPKLRFNRADHSYPAGDRELVAYRERFGPNQVAGGDDLVAGAKLIAIVHEVPGRRYRCMAGNVTGGHLGSSEPPTRSPQRLGFSD
jgi:hypothetical protein